VSNSTWQIEKQTIAVPNRPEATEYKITFVCTSGQLDQASISITLAYNDWKEQNYVLLPGAAYNGNRFPWRRLRYSPKLHDIKDIGPDKPIIITDVPKLSADGGVSRIQERSGSMSTPSIGVYDIQRSQSCWILTTQGNQWGDYGIEVEESRDRNQCLISLSSPVVREQYAYVFCDNRKASWDLPATFKTGDTVSFLVRTYDYEAKQVQHLFDSFFPIRKDFSNPTQTTRLLPFSVCMQTLEEKFNRENFVHEFGYYSVGMRENFLQDWQIGWTGGMISTLPLLAAGNKETQNRVLRNFDWLFPNGISPSGFYWDAGQKGTQWLGGDIRNQHTKNWHLIRKSGDAIWYITRQFMLMDERGIPVKESWRSGNRSVCDRFVQLWNQNRQIGQFVDALTGEIVVGGSTSGAIVPAGLVVAAQYYQDPKFLQAAQEIGAYFYQNFTQKGITCGGPGDALQNPDSESAAALVESYVALYEGTKDKIWLHRAEEAAKQFATWVVTYPYRYPDTTAFYKAGINTLGSVYANTQNKHAAPGICTASGIGLFKLYRYTGNQLYIELLQDIAHQMPQYLPHPLQPLGKAPLGWVSERVNLTDWEGPQSIGYILPISTWAETSLMLTTVELPGLYVVPDRSFFVCFDNLHVQKIKENQKELILQITNPGPAPAEVKIMTEWSHQQANMLKEITTYRHPVLMLQPGQTLTRSFSKK
jgi:hypothetical protein